MQGVFKKENQMPKHLPFALRLNWSMGPIDSGTKGTHIHHE